MTLTIRRSDCANLLEPISGLTLNEALFKIKNKTDEDSIDKIIGRLAHYWALETDGWDVPDQIAFLDFDSYRSKAAQEARDDAIKSGRSPILRVHEKVIKDMVAALRDNKYFATRKRSGKPEHKLEWIDAKTEVKCTCTLDWLPEGGGLFWDYKTTHTLTENGLEKMAASHGYFFQAAWYMAGIRECGLCADPVFEFIVQSKKPPYEVRFFSFEDSALQLGELAMEAALRLFKASLGDAPQRQQSADKLILSLPNYTHYQVQEWADQVMEMEMEGI